jgi:hypothetical protein
LLLLAPKRDDSYQTLALLCAVTEDADGMKAVAARAAAAGVDTAEDAAKYLDELTGKSDDKKADERRAAAARAWEALAAARTVGGRTYALAVGRYVTAKIGGWAYGFAADPDELVSLADAVHAATPSAGTEATVVSALRFRAHRALIAADLGYAAAAKKTHRSFGSALLTYVLGTDGPLRTKAAQNADVRRLAGLFEEELRRDPDRVSADEWVLLKAVGSPQAAAFGEKVQANDRARSRLALDRTLSPYSAGTALELYHSLLLEGKTAEAKQAIADLGKNGVPVP